VRVKPASDAQVRKLMEEMSKKGRIGHAAMKAGMDRKTARKYVRERKLPSEMRTSRDWRTRPDPFEEDWPKVQARLEEEPTLGALTLFDWLVEQQPGRYQAGQLRTLQRRIQRWRVERGPERETELAQRHRPGEAAQTDFTAASELGVTVLGQLLVHLLCVTVLPYSNWQWATVCVSESMAALRRGVQRALFQLGRVPRYHQTDNSTAATHRIPDGKSVPFAGGRRPFNADYVALMSHLGMTPRTTEVGAKEQNGDVEAANGAIKRRLDQALKLRGHRDFDSVEQWQSFVDATLTKSNRGRSARVAEELAAMREIHVAKLPEYVEDTVRVSDWSTIRLKHCAYSVPSRLIGEHVVARLYEERLEVFYRGTLQLACERLRGRNVARIDYRHVIWSLVRKPGAFARYVYREEMFPTVIFRRAYDAMQAAQAGTKGDVEYLRVLHLAASTMEADVEAALGSLLDENKPVTCDAVKALVRTEARIETPNIIAPTVDLGVYDALLAEVRS
jgi:hypothetical protein